MERNAGNISKKLKGFRDENVPERNCIHFNKVEG